MRCRPRCRQVKVFEARLCLSHAGRYEEKPLCELLDKFGGKYLWETVNDAVMCWEFVVGEVLNWV